MKKFLLTLAALAMGSTMFAATGLVLIDSNNRGVWTGDASGWSCDITCNGSTFTISTEKVSSTATDLVDPALNSSWRVYKGSAFTITSNDIVLKQIVVTFDDYTTDSGTTYYGTLELSSGWEGTLNEEDLTYTCVNSGATTMTATASAKQVRIVSLVVSTEDGEITDTIAPEEAYAEGIVYSNNFGYDGCLDEWTLINDETLNDGDYYSGWRYYSSYSCIYANSYWNGSAKFASTKVEKTFDLSNYEDCSFEFDQKLGYFIPTSSSQDYYRVYVIDEKGYVNYLAMANLGDAASSWQSSWTNNSFDISEFDGTVVTIGFDYNNYEAISMGWEIKNFVVYGSNVQGAVGSIADDATTGNPVYYNLQGVRVANPENGIFIKVDGNKTTKILK